MEEMKININEEEVIKKTLAQLSLCIEKYLNAGLTATSKTGEKRVKTLVEVIKKAMRYHGYPDAKACAKDLGFPYELFRKVVGEGHIPRDEQLMIYADKLGIDKAQLIRLAHYWRTPPEAREYLSDLVSECPLIKSE